ncbi:hypothetical protein K435DRAFT_606303, partial [Dendrothele bispora CBS 962.96]
LSVDLRKRIVHWRFTEGMEIQEITRLAGCAQRTVYNILELYQQTGEYCPPSGDVGRHRTLTMTDKSYLLSTLNLNPTFYLDELQDAIWKDREVE